MACNNIGILLVTQVETEQLFLSQNKPHVQPSKGHFQSGFCAGSWNPDDYHLTIEQFYAVITLQTHNDEWRMDDRNFPFSNAS